MNRKKTLLLSILCLMLTVSLAACGSSNNNGKITNPSPDPANSQAPNPAPGEKTKLTYWTGDRHDADYIKEVIQRFNETNSDNIEVELVVKTEDYDQALEIAFVSNRSPDLFRAKENMIQSFYKKNYMEPLDSFLTEEMKAKFPQIVDFNTFDGKMYSLPNYGATMRLIYNKELFAKAGISEPPTTLAEMVEAAKKITEVGKSEGAYGFALNFKNPGSALGRSARVIAEISGYGGFGYDFQKGEFDFNGYKDIIAAFKQMMDDGSMLPGVESLDIDPLRAQFAEGKIGMYLSYSSEPGVYKEQFPAKIEWAAALPPTVDGNLNGAAGFLGGQWLVLSQQSKNKEAAWKFMEYMYSDEVLQTYHEKGLGISMVPHISEKAKAPDINGIEGFLPTKYDGVWPLHPTVTVEGLDYNNEFFKYMVKGGNLDEIVEGLNKRYNSALEKARANGETDAAPMPDFSPAQLQNQFGN